MVSGRGWNTMVSRVISGSEDIAQPVRTARNQAQQLLDHKLRARTTCCHSGGNISRADPRCRR